MDEAASKPSARPKRRSHQFILKAILAWVAVTYVLLALGYRWIASARRQHAVVEMVERTGGSVVYANPPADELWPITMLRGGLSQDYFGDIVTVKLGSAPSPQSFRLFPSRHVSSRRMKVNVTDSSLVSLKSLSHLKRLEIYGPDVTDTGLSHLQGMTQLKSLKLNSTQVTDAGMARIRTALPNCRIDP